MKKRSIRLLLSALLVLAMAFQSFAAPLSSMNPAAASEPAKITGTWSTDASGSWRFNAPDGAAKDGWYYLNTTNDATDYNWFCFDANGVMRTGWVPDKNDPSVWYYTGETKDSSEGGLVKGWITDPQDGQRYYLDPSTGIMCHGWKQIDGVWYYFTESRYADRGWAPDTKGYWMDKATGRHSHGSLYVNERTPDGYYVGITGAWLVNGGSSSGGSYTPPAPPAEPSAAVDVEKVTVKDNGKLQAGEGEVSITSGDEKTRLELPKEKAVQLAEKINTMLDSAPVAQFTGSGLKESSKIDTTEGLQAIINELQASTGDETAKNSIGSKTASDIDLQIKIVLSDVNINASDDLTVTSMEFDVTPIASTTVKDSNGDTITVSTEIKKELSEKVKFRLPIDSSLAADGNKIAVYHEGEFFGNYEIQGVTPNTYIEIESRNFSKFGYSVLNANNAAAKIGDTLYFKFADAAESVGNEETITLLKPAVGEVTINREVTFTVDKNGRNFNATVKAAAGYNIRQQGVSESSIVFTCKKQVTVTFNMNGHGTQIAPITGVACGAKISAPAAPEAEGYSFGGWYKEAACTNAWSFDTDTVTADTTLYAKWTIVPSTYGIIVEDDGHGTASATVGGKTVTAAAANAEVTLTATPDEGYRLKEWVVVSGGVSVSENKFTMPANNVTVQAVFEAVPETKKLSEILPAGFPSSADSAWVNEGGLKAYKDGDNIKVGNLTLGKDTTVTKSGDNYVCNSGDATVTFNIKDGAAESITVTGSSDSNGTYTPAPTISTIADVLATAGDNAPSATSHWYDTKGNYIYTNGGQLLVYVSLFGGAAGVALDNTVTPNGDNYLYSDGVLSFTFNMTEGVLTSIHVNMSAYGVNDTFSPAPAASIAFDENPFEPGNIKAIQTLTIKGKNLDLVTKVIFCDNVEVTNFKSQSSEQIVIEKFPVKARTGKVTLVNGTTSQEVTSDVDLVVAQPSVSEIYQFTGVTSKQKLTINGENFDLVYDAIIGDDTYLDYTVKNEGHTIEIDMPEEVHDGTVKVIAYSGVEVTVATVTAAAPATTYTVTFNLNGATGTAPVSQSIASGSKATKPDDPTFTDHTFAGWYKTKDATTGALSDPWDFDNDTVTANVTLYAKWKPEDEGSYILKAQGNWFKAFSGTTEDKTKITDIIFCKKLPQGVSAENPVNPTDDSENGKVKGYIVANGDNYKIYIVGDYIFGNSVCYNMFSGFSNLKTLDFGNFDTSKVTIMFSMFNGCSGLTFLDLSSFDTSETSTMQSMFTGCSKLESITFGTDFDTSKVTSMTSMFNGCSALKSLDLSSFDTSKVTKMNSMFQGCKALKSLDLSKFNTAKVEGMPSMFNGCSALGSLDLSKFDTSAVTDMNGMFTDCSSLESITFGTNFNTSKVTGMNAMFSGCSALESLDLSRFDTSAVTNMDAMFKNCSALESLDLSKFYTSAVAKMSNMFNGCSTLERLDISHFTVGSDTIVDDMFKDCSELTSVKISPENEKIAGALGEGWTYDGVTKAYVRSSSLLKASGTSSDPVNDAPMAETEVSEPVAEVFEPEFEPEKFEEAKPEELIEPAEAVAEEAAP